MNPSDLNTVVFYRGLALNAGPTRGQETLFVVSERSLAEIRAFSADVDHVLIGARRPGSPDLGGAAADWPALVDIVTGLLDDGRWVTVRFSASEFAEMSRRLSAAWGRARFVPELFVAVPPGAAHPNQVLTLEHHHPFGGAWAVALCELERARSWRPLAAEGAYRILARVEDLT